jgi:radical SAM protein with 4Fe4S-binding SPASM domain
VRAALNRYLQWKLHSLRLDQLADEHRLRYLFLEVTRRCNYRCVYCGSDCTGAEQRPEMDTAAWVQVARQVADDFDASEVMIAVTGGEPLFKPDILDLFRELRRLKFPFGMVTNGALMDREMARKVVDTGIGSITISLDAPAEINDALRGPGAAAKVETAVSELLAAGFKGKLEIFTTVTRPVIPHLEAMRRRIAEMRTPLWRLAVAMPIGRAKDRPDLVPGPAELRTLFDFIKAGRQDELLPQPELGEEGYLGDDYEGVIRPYLCQCKAGINIAGILADGRIGACPELADDFVQGHLNRERLKTVWNERYQIFRDRSWTRRGICADCDAFSRCRGSGLHLYPDTKSEPLRCFYKMLEEERPR